MALMVLGHGAGTPIHTPLMVQMAEALAVRGIATLRYNYPYSESIETIFSPDIIDPLDVLLTTASSAVNAARSLSLDLTLFLGGRSMSSQVITHRPRESVLSSGYPKSTTPYHPDTTSCHPTSPALCRHPDTT